jgi:hypothetical protein
MGNRRLYKVERFHTLGKSESEGLKVTALNLFHPTASPPFPKNRFFHIATQSLQTGGFGWGAFLNLQHKKPSAVTPYVLAPYFMLWSKSTPQYNIFYAIG